MRGADWLLLVVLLQLLGNGYLLTLLWRSVMREDALHELLAGVYDRLEAGRGADLVDDDPAWLELEQRLLDESADQGPDGPGRFRDVPPF